MKQYPNIWFSAQALESYREGGPRCRTESGWVPARPEGFPTFKNRAKAAWLVFIGKADALIWESNQ